MASFYLEAALLIPAKQLFAVSVTVILLDSVTHFLAEREKAGHGEKSRFFRWLRLQTCECTKWKQTRNRPVINTFTASVSAEGRLLLFLGRLPQWRVSWRVTGCRPKQIWLCWTAQEPESPAAGRWDPTAGKMRLTAVLLLLFSLNTDTLLVFPQQSSHTHCGYVCECYK